MSATFSGSLQVKKKAELQDIARSLAINESGTREDLQQRIKKHLDDNIAELESDPAFSGLYTTRGGRRQRSVQPSGPAAATHSEASKFSAIPEERAVTPPAEDMRDVSMLLPQAAQTPTTSPRTSPRKAPTSPRNVPSLPSSPARTLVSQTLEQQEVKSASEAGPTFGEKVSYTVSATRTFLSSSRNIFVVSTLLDFIGILYQIHINSVFPIPPVLVSAEPALSTTAMAAMYWSVPTIVLPAIVGYLVSFSSSPSQPRFDVLSAAIIRAAANVPNFYPALAFADKKGEVQSLDVLGFKWRAVSSGVTLAFAFAEAIVKRSEA